MPEHSAPATDRDPRLRAALSFVGQTDLAGLTTRVYQALTALPRLHGAGLSIYDEPRQVFTTLIVTPDPDEPHEPAEPLEIEDEVAPARVAALAEFQQLLVSADQPPLTWLPAHHALLAAGVQRYACAPLQLGPRLLGILFAGFATDAPLPADVQSLLRDLARLVTPTVWNCHIEQRFQRGDRRRDTLAELSDAINQSLELNTVLDSACRAIARLHGHPYGAINLLEPDEQHLVSYRSARDTPAPPPPERHAVTDTVMAWILTHRRTYQSDDLHRATAFAHDGPLRTLGVRRYVATPMFVRGRIVGSLLMGSTDRHRALAIDVWLYENIALQLALAIDNARQLSEVQRLSERLAQQNVYLREEIQSEHDFSEMIGQTPAMQQVRAAIQCVAPTPSIVLISGETGVGKELVARAIHAASPRAEQPMVKVNCAAIPEGMVESELFGHERGAFTSAVERRIGRFELAHEGTLFLDEIGELPLGVQAKLLRVLQDGEFERVGGSRTLRTSARVMAATNRDLLRCAELGTFRSDLYYRLNVFPIDVPPLRARPEDIPLLVTSFVAQLSRRMGKRIERVGPETMERLARAPWPGNVRELRHVIERAMILCDGPTLGIPASDLGHPPTAPRPAAARSELATLSDIEADHIRQVLVSTRGVIEGERGAAKLLGLKPSTLRFRMKRLGIKRPR